MAGSPRRTAGRRLQLPLLCLLLQGATAILFAVFVRYNHETDAALWHWHNHSNADNEFYFRYPSFQDVHTMIFVGFGFLMVFLQRYGFSSVGFTFLSAAFALQWSTLVQGFFHSFHHGHIYVGVERAALASSPLSPSPSQPPSMINADFCAGAVLISFGAILGKTGPAQLLLMALLEVVLFGLNEFVLLSLLRVKDAGGSMTIHAFGAYFGLVLSRVLYRPQLEKSKHRQGSVYHSDLFAMIGTIFLWIFWPSFNSAPTALGDGQHRSALNTYYSLTASTLSTFALSALVGRDGRLDMVHIQNAALAGGVVVGTSAEMMLTPFGALVAGFLAGTVSTLGYKFFTPTLESKLKVQDTCGVHNLHGMPGVLGALLGVLVAGLATHEAYGDGLESVFPLLAKGQRSATSQAMHQLFGLFVTLIFASVGGSLGGHLQVVPRRGWTRDACSEGGPLSLSGLDFWSSLGLLWMVFGRSLGRTQADPSWL
ncbi:ammonium transporter Rh type B isoform X1 [Sagmatias obliquidens]|uniref:Ammonium transporter Rh type B n=1 Tax=Tursiops truncatus TaxID=9739 RepID=A0A6J3RE54_TURTR|nr:ammonium transporter Rh type B isoform X1 [Lagenorhynchus obliquidens]XP_030697935.1 ammonium transporter Rh type B isoform X1 [Globicephala melas]XP_033713061.1 ammonium transporter Rh type B isoform X1 [Tursiops truncatus]